MDSRKLNPVEELYEKKLKRTLEEAGKDMLESKTKLFNLLMNLED